MLFWVLREMRHRKKLSTRILKLPKNYIRIRTRPLGKPNYSWALNRPMKLLSNPKRRALYDATLPPYKKISLPYESQINIQPSKFSAVG